MIIDQQVYNGELIHDRFAYKFFRKDVSPYGNIVAFRAPMYVNDNLIDLEDTLAKDFIHSDDAKPSESDCTAGVAALQTAYDAQAYARSRLTEYPTIEECVHAILDDDLTALQVKRQAVKDKYPKE